MIKSSDGCGLWEEILTFSQITCLLNSVHSGSDKCVPQCPIAPALVCGLPGQLYLQPVGCETVGSRTVNLEFFFLPSLFSILIIRCLPAGGALTGKNSCLMI